MKTELTQLDFNTGCKQGSTFFIKLEKPEMITAQQLKMLLIADEVACDCLQDDRFYGINFAMQDMQE